MGLRFRHYLIPSILLLFLIVFPLTYGLWASYGEWSGTSQDRYLNKGSTFQAPQLKHGPVVLVFAARSARWRGVVSVHSWIAIRPRNQAVFTRYEVVGWNREKSFVRKSTGNEDAYWYGYRPVKLFEALGPKAEVLIERIEQEVERYPYRDRYGAWPGPNSNTFVAHIARQIPELEVDLPPTAIGKDYIPGFHMSRPPSSRGWQLGFGGYAGITLSPQEGFEINIASAVYGFDFQPLALKMPAIGRIE
jgi:hypothetical protein